MLDVSTNTYIMGIFSKTKSVLAGYWTISLFKCAFDYKYASSFERSKCEEGEMSWTEKKKKLSVGILKKSYTNKNAASYTLKKIIFQVCNSSGRAYPKMFSPHRRNRLTCSLFDPTITKECVDTLATCPSFDAQFWAFLWNKETFFKNKLQII